jgi:[ribosomal protein S18]-alanine N-acetyltransferase
MSQLSIQPMSPSHIDQALLIEQAGTSHPWTYGIFVDELEQSETRAYRVAIVNETVVGFGGVLHQVGEAHITNIAVAHAWRRQGIARALMVELLTAAVAGGAVSATLEVRVSNDSARRLYHQFGFAPVGIRPAYYPDGESAVIMWAHDVATPQFASRLAQLLRYGATA